MREVLSRDYPAVPKSPPVGVPTFKPPPLGRLREIKVTYRRSMIPVNRGIAVESSFDLWNAFRNLASESVEVFRVVFLDHRRGLLAYEDVARGTVGRLVIHPREVFFSAVHLRASAIAVLHNHPEDEIRPSARDIEVTRKLRLAAAVIDIPLLDTSSSAKTASTPCGTMAGNRSLVNTGRRATRGLRPAASYQPSQPTDHEKCGLGGYHTTAHSFSSSSLGSPLCSPARMHLAPGE